MSLSIKSALAGLIPAKKKTGKRSRWAWAVMRLGRGSNAVGQGHCAAGQGLSLDWAGAVILQWILGHASFALPTSIPTYLPTYGHALL